MMKNNWEKKAAANKRKAFLVAIVVHVIFLMSVMSFGNSSDEDGGITDWIKSKFKTEQVDKPAA